MEIVEWTSNAISRLYALRIVGYGANEDVSTLIGDIRRSKDSVFIKPLFDTYSRLRGATFSHYFVAALGEYPERLATDCLLEIARDPECKEANFLYALDGLGTRGEIVEDLTSKAVDFLINSDRFEIEAYDLAQVCHYFSVLFERDKAKSPAVAGILRTIWKDSKLKRDLRVEAFEKDLAFEKDSCLNEVINYLLNLDEDGQIVVAETLSSWKGGRVEKIKLSLLEKGSQMAKKIIADSQNTDAKKSMEAQQKENEDYANLSLLNEISDAWQAVNRNSLYMLGHALFNEMAARFCFDNAKPKNTKDGFLACCSSMRSLLESPLSDDLRIEDALITDNLLAELRIEQEMKGRALARLAICLRQRSVEVDHRVYGLRLLIKLCSKEIHEATDNVNFTVILHEMNLDIYFLEQRWAELHKALLQYLLKSLKQISEAVLMTVPSKK